MRPPGHMAFYYIPTIRYTAPYYLPQPTPNPTKTSSIMTLERIYLSL